jgi:stringent starvation protein B
MQGSLDNQGTSTRPYLLRALHDWCSDNGFTPYVAVYVDASVQVPMEHVKNNEIVLNIGFEATTGLKLGNEFIEFKARFGGTSREIVVPVDHVVAIYARENGQGMAFPVPTDGGQAAAAKAIQAGVAPRGLRLAASGADAQTAVTPLVGVQTAAVKPDDEPPDPAAPAAPGGRPSLKRIK